MRRRRTNLIAALLLPLALPLSLVGLGLAPAHAATVNYVAMGDSYSSGTGAPGATGTCNRSPQGYPTLWATAHGISTFTDVTCAGATTDNVLNSQISALTAQTNVVTITIGGNDVGFASTVVTCLFLGDQACASTVSQTEANAATYVAKADTTYTAIRKGAPNAQVYVLGYPYLFETTAACPSGPSLSVAQRTTLHDGVNFLDDHLATEAAKFGFHFVDVRSVFAGHGDCAGSPWINGLTNLAGPLHPNAAGYKQGYLTALTAVTG